MGILDTIKSLFAPAPGAQAGHAVGLPTARSLDGAPEFVAVLAGAPDNVDYAELRKLAAEELVRFLEGKDDSDNP